MTVQADLVKHVIFAPMCARYVMAGVEALEHRGQGADSSLCLTIPSSNLNLLTNFSISWVVGMVVWSVPVQKKLALTPYIGQARKDRARARLCAGCGSQQIGHNSEVCMISLLIFS